MPEGRDESAAASPARTMLAMQKVLAGYKSHRDSGTVAATIVTGGGRAGSERHAVDVAASTIFLSVGGDIYVQAATAITVDAAIVSQPGTGGVLTVSGPVALNVPPILGAGNITLIVGGTPVPALATWGVLLLAALIGLAAAWRLRGV